MLSGIGVTWYTWLEQGRPINVSAQVLEAVARTLRLDPTERSHLYRLAEVAEPETSGQPAGQYGLEPDVQGLLDRLAPYPACVLNTRYDVLAWNVSYAVLWRRTLAAPEAERNILWQSFLIPACCSPFAENREGELADMVAAFRTSYGRHLGDPAWEDLIERLSKASTEFAAAWAVHDVAASAPRVKTMRHAAAGDIAMSVTAFDLVTVPEARMIVYTPAGPDDLKRVEWVLAHPEAPPTDHDHTQ